MIDSNKIRSLSKLCKFIETKTKEFLPGRYWIKAQISKISESKGIWYLDLIEPIPGSIHPYKMKGLIFSDKYRQITTRLGSELVSDTEMIFLCKVVFDGRFGMSLQILDAENELTIIEQEKERVIGLLSKEGIIGNNKKLEVPYLIKKIALISSVNSDGYHDFMTQLSTYRKYLEITEFNTTVQGKDASNSITTQLVKIDHLKEQYDVIVIVRGGGSSTDLSVFNDERLARTICSISIPVITGIGHQKNVSVIDEIAKVQKMNPTDAAHFISEHYRTRIEEYDTLSVSFSNGVKNILSIKLEKLISMKNNLIDNSRDSYNRYQDVWKNSILAIKAVKGKIETHQFIITNHSRSIILNSNRIIKNGQENITEKSIDLSRYSNTATEIQNNKLNTFKKVIKLADPVNTLKLGYAITSQNGRIIKDIKELTNQDTLLVRYSSGEVSTQIKNTKENQK